jgi:DNA polymerase-3 subunit epsilon
MTILSEDALEAAMRWLADHLKFELNRQAWETYVEAFPEEGASLFLFPSAWRVPGVDDYVGFSFYWPNDTQGEAPCVQLYLPPEERFPNRNQLLSQLRPQLRLVGFTDHYEGEDDPDPSCPLWKYIRFDFGGKTGVDLPSLLAAILKGFQELMQVEEVIGEVFRSMPPPPPPSERRLRTIAFLDTEWLGQEPTRKMIELAIVNVAYDAVEDEVVGILEEYVMKKGEKLNKEKARSLLDQAHRIVAHNASSDQSLLARELPGIKKSKWMCSFRGIEWKRLMGVQSGRQSSLVGKAGLRYEQDHHAQADAHDLKRLLAQKHEGGRTYLGRLLDGDSQKNS